MSGTFPEDIGVRANLGRPEPKKATWEEVTIQSVANIQL